MSEIKHSENEPLLSQQRRFPEVFRWKVAAIIISVLIAIFLVVDIILLVHYNNSQPRSINHTFLADLLDYSASNGDTYSTKQFINMATALSNSYSEMWFQSASLVQAWNAASGQLTLDTIGGFFDGDSDHQLLVLTLSDGTNTVIAGAYSHIGFPLPSGDWQSYVTGTGKQYYTFEIDDRQSVLLGGGDPSFLRMSGSTDNLLNCRVLRLTDSTFTLLELLSLDYSTAPATVALDVTAINAPCFNGQPLPADALTSLQTILGVAAGGLTVVKLQAFHLSA